MGVFPAGSRSHVPEPWADLMLNPVRILNHYYLFDYVTLILISRFFMAFFIGFRNLKS